VSATVPRHDMDSLTDASFSRRTSIVDGRLNYMETQPGGLADPASFRTHVTAARDGLVGMNASYENRDREREGALPSSLWLSLMVHHS
jgi:hypothetical protein